METTQKKWNPYSATCPTRIVLDHIADKWTVLVLGLLGEKPMRFNQLRRSIDGISQKVLTKLLRGLEQHNLVTRTVFPTVPVTVEYALTPLGRSLQETVDPLRHWAEDNIEEILAAQAQ